MKKEQDDKKKKRKMEKDGKKAKEKKCDIRIQAAKKMTSSGMTPGLED